MKNDCKILKSVLNYINGTQDLFLKSKESENILDEIQYINFCDEPEQFPDNHLQTKYRLERLSNICDSAFIVISSTLEKTVELKEKYITIVFSGNETIDSNMNLKRSHRLMTDAIKRDHEIPKSHHYSNEIDMIYNIMLGKDAKQFRNRQ